MTRLLQFPASTARIQIARDANGAPVGVTVSLLVLTDDVKNLPEPYRKSAQAMLYAEAAKEQ